MIPRHELSPNISVFWKALPALTAAVAAVLVSHVMPLLGPLLLALVLGAVLANTRWAQKSVLADHAAATKLLLRIGVVLIGLRLSLGEIASIGVRGVVVIVVTVAATYGLTQYAGRRAGLDHQFVTLLSAGFSICGAAAVAAVNDAVNARQRDVALAVALVTVYGSGMIVAVPLLAGWLGLSGRQAAIWAGASIHEVAQVVAAGSALGGGAIGVALTVKLGRVALLAPLYTVAARESRTAGARVPIVPWFLTGFAVAVAVRSSGIVPGRVLSVLDVVTTVLLAAGMFGLGLGFRVRELWPVPGRALWLATTSTAVAAGSSLLLIVALY
ncbi:YeiH family protein [Streptomyces olindensis]|uniref:YeiH family protein n=1 Tax=Streptomyces olindensis TaxID=358823 RepID=UPI0036ABE47F